MNIFRIVAVLAFGGVAFFCYTTNNTAGMIVFIPMTVIAYFFTSKERTEALNEDLAGDDNTNDDGESFTGLTYIGSELVFTDEYLVDALVKYIPYYNALSFPGQHKFLERLKAFIKDKVFVINDKSGYKEMPILISAAAIQLSFGLDEYLLPYFKYINIYPDAFTRQDDDKLCFLEGNVSGNEINIGWAYFLEGFQNPTDGKNVGLHEMSHALYYQTMVADKGLDTAFSANYKAFDSYGDKIFNDAKDADGVLFNDYAFKNLQEFWAQSVELFFECGADMKAKYPELYRAIAVLLNQDTTGRSTSLGNAQDP